MAEQPLAKMVEIAVRAFASEEGDAAQQSSKTVEDEDEDSNPTRKRRRVEVEPHDAEEDSIQTLLYTASKSLCLRLDTIESHLSSMEDKCKCLRAKVDLLVGPGSVRSNPGHRAPGDRQGPGTRSSTTPPPQTSPQDPAEEDPAPKEFGDTARASQDLGEMGEGQLGSLQGLGPGVHIVTLCADGRGSEGEDRVDATNLLYQLMY
ncbi:uncharacterized protein LOC125449019 [Stegostoma tigrinum]|uniref:uncharacterized protein LOC125449019 n=1 Tax=Stegostoma tigrinum TaxID=3053191 RepID=UPI00202AF0C1|nr:uncharacterized protein LOC125449019 [Stegostoma tigrinum]XP_048380539.1 uncharacterized protein LOC125449019 [Stegostoma tigrinum]